MALVGVFPCDVFFILAKALCSAIKSENFPYLKNTLLSVSVPMCFCANVFLSSRKMIICVFKQQFIFQSC
jgi:hypothetical protein